MKVHVQFCKWQWRNDEFFYDCPWRMYYRGFILVTLEGFYKGWKP